MEPAAIPGGRTSLAQASRPPEQVLRLARMGASHQTRLSFLRAMLRRLKREQWRFERPVWRIDGKGEGVAVYRAQGPLRCYSLVCFSRDLPDDLRTDRVIAEAWDTTYALVDGEPSEADLTRLAENVPRQEAGRCLASELVLCRANRSVRLFETVVAALADGRQPERRLIEEVGYLMRTTAVYGNGKFGIADRDVLADRPELAGPFRAEMLAVWLVRSFTVDLAEHLARCRAPERAVSLQPHLRRRLGVGNSTGLGMAPFLVRHPALVHNWLAAREAALARVRALPGASLEQIVVLARAIGRTRDAVGDWRTADATLGTAIAGLADDLARLADHVAGGALDLDHPWDRLVAWSEASLSLEGQEMAVSLVLEPHGPLVDDLAETMAVDEEAHFDIDGAMTCGTLRDGIARHYRWALRPDYGQPAEQARFWYTSVAKLEPRLGERWEEPGGELEQPLGVGRDVAALARDLPAGGSDERVGAFLARHPEHRHTVRRVQTGLARPYAEVHDNLLSAGMRPIDILRFKLAFFGATRFDPRSDRWLRITLFQGAPFPEELAVRSAEDWIHSSSLDVR